MADLHSADEDDSARDLPAMESAAAFGLALAVASREKADAFLDAQTRIAWLQKEHLHEQRDLQISHLRWRRFNNRMHGAVQILFALTGVFVLSGLALLFWNASHAANLEVDAFSVPPAFEQRGMGGDVIAADMTQRLGEVRNVATAHSFSTSNDVSSGHNDIKVEIPDTGISISEAWRLLKGWLGHERHLKGSLREENGLVTLSASLDGTIASTATGKPAELASLEQRVAEAVFGVFDPVNVVNYLSAQHRHREAYAAAAHFVSIASGAAARADSYGLFGYTTIDATGDYELGLARFRYGMAIDPELAVLHVLTMRTERALGRDEESLRQARILPTLKEGDQLPQHRGAGFADMLGQAHATVALLTGDFSDASGWRCNHGCFIGYSQLATAALLALAHDATGAEARLETARAVGARDPLVESEAGAQIAVARQDWVRARAAAAAARALARVPDGDQSVRAAQVSADYADVPLLAEADAHLGNFARARAEIAQTQTDCVPCDVTRGDIDALARQGNAAAFWYARAEALAPSIPFADTQWGAMLLRENKYDAAIAKFAAASSKGPHYADPLEMWGEALMQQNRSDLALAKFEEADKYAPNWGRLHFEWGKALYHAGQKDGAKKEFALAAQLELSQADRAALMSWKTRHG